MERVNLSISGMTCGHCVGRVEKALKALEGVTVEKIDLKSAVLAIDPNRVSSPAVVRAVADAGYEVSATSPA
jgi:copper chaperone CopZ